MTVIKHVRRTLILCTSAFGFAGCTALAELAYDLSLEDQKRVCERIPEMGAYRECVERARKSARQAEQARKPS